MSAAVWRKKGRRLPGCASVIRKCENARCKRRRCSGGAGDGFAAGFLSGLIDNKSLYECGEMANGVGAMATLVRGDTEGYPTRQQLLEFIGKAKSIER